MEVKGQTIILEAGDEVTIKAREREEPQPAPDPVPTDGRLSFEQLLYEFNDILVTRGYNSVQGGMQVYDYMSWAYDFAKRQYDGDVWMFVPSTYPLVYDYRGDDMIGAAVGYNAMQAFLMASILAELVPDKGKYTNTQTLLYGLAYSLGGGVAYPMYNGKALKADPYAMRDAAGIMYAICRSDESIAQNIGVYREELGGHEIPASAWGDLGYKNHKIVIDGWVKGYEVEEVGYAINLKQFIPDAPGPRVEGTTVCDLPLPWYQGQPEEQFDLDTQNYKIDEEVYCRVVDHFNMMSMTPLEVWAGYSQEKKNILINTAAIPICSKNYMFCRKNVQFDGKVYKTYDGVTYADYFTFSETNEYTGLVLDGPFSNLQGIYRFNAVNPNGREMFIDNVSEMADNMRWSLMDPNYGRCRPGCVCTHDGGERDPEHGAPANELYNIDLSAIVADTIQEREDLLREDGFAADSPRSYVSGHSAQIWCIALMLCQMKECEEQKEWITKAYQYSVCRVIGRYHWMSDVIYGRMIGAMTLPIINAMSGMHDGYEEMKAFVLKPEPQGDYSARIIIRNETGQPIESTGEIRLYVRDHIGIDANLPGWVAQGAAYTFEVGDSMYDTTLLVHGDDVPPVDFDGEAVNEVRFYDYRHYNNIDAGFYASLDLDDPECCNRIEAGATYVIRITTI